MNNYDNNYYSTSDLALASALVCYGFVIECLEKDQSGRVAFYFVRQSALDGTTQAFWANTLTVNPRTYFDAIKHLKTRIYSEA